MLLFKCCCLLGCAALLIVDDHLRCSFAHFKLVAHLLDLGCLLFQACGENLHFLPLVRDDRFKLSDAGLEAFALLRNHHFQFPQLAALLLHFAVLFEELVEQHRVHRLVAHGVDLTLLIASHQSGVHLFYLLGHQPKLRDALRVKVVFVAEGHRFERENRFTRLVHGLDLVLETLRGNYRAEVTTAIYNYPYTSGHSVPANAGDKGVSLPLVTAVADADCVGFAYRGCWHRVSRLFLFGYGVGDDVNIVTARREILTGSCAQGDVAPADCVASKRSPTVGRVEVGGCAVTERQKTGGRVAGAGCVGIERRRTGGRVVSAGGEAKESVVTLSGVEAGIASVWCRGNRLRRRRKRKPGEGEGERDEKETEPQKRAAD